MSVDNSYVYSYDSHMNPIRISRTRKKNNYITVDLARSMQAERSQFIRAEILIILRCCIFLSEENGAEGKAIGAKSSGI